MKKIAILGSTGSIGTQTLEVIRENKDIEVTGLSAVTNVDLPGSGCKGCFRNGWTSGDCHDGGK